MNRGSHVQKILRALSGLSGETDASFPGRQGYYQLFGVR